MLDEESSMEMHTYKNTDNLSVHTMITDYVSKHKIGGSVIRHIFFSSKYDWIYSLYFVIYYISFIWTLQVTTGVIRRSYYYTPDLGHCWLMIWWDDDDDDNDDQDAAAPLFGRAQTDNPRKHVVFSRSLWYTHWSWWHGIIYKKLMN